MSARRAAAESARLARLRERVRYMQQDLVNGTLYNKKLYVPEPKEQDGVDMCIEEMLTRLDGHLPNKPFHQMRHIKPSVRRFQEREGLGFRNWLSWVRECQSIIAPDIFAPMTPPTCTYAENQEEGINDFDEFEPRINMDQLPSTQRVIPIGRISLRMPPENEDEDTILARPPVGEDSEDDDGFGIHLDPIHPVTGEVMELLPAEEESGVAPLDHEYASSYEEEHMPDSEEEEYARRMRSDSDARANAASTLRLHPYLLVSHEDLAALIEEKGI